MALKGSQTEQYLKEAFAGRAQAHCRYSYRAIRADVEGYPAAAALFRSMAEAAMGQAYGHLEYLEQCGDPVTGLPFGTTEENLRSGMAEAVDHSSTRYGVMAAGAREEGLYEVADWFEALARMEHGHAHRYQKALHELNPPLTESAIA